MPTLTLHPSRALTPFIEGSYAYAYADHGARQNGVLITPQALTAQATSEGSISFDLIASSLADDCDDFTYTVAAFDPQGGRIWIANILMPDQDAQIWSLMPECVDLDARGVAPVEPEPEPDVYCGVEPVEPDAGTDILLVEGSVFYDTNDETNRLQFTWPENSDTTATNIADLLSVDDSIVAKIIYLEHDEPQLPIGFMYSVVNPFGTALVAPVPDPTADVYIQDSNDEIYPQTFTDGQYVRFIYSVDGGYDVLTIADFDYPYIEGPTQAETNAYTIAKATYDQCIADGGIPGEQS